MKTRTTRISAELFNMRCQIAGQFEKAYGYKPSLTVVDGMISKAWLNGKIDILVPLNNNKSRFQHRRGKNEVRFDL